MRGCIALLAIVISSLARAETPLEHWRTMKYGFFVHYVWDGGGNVTYNPDGSKPGDINSFCDRFDAQGFADDIAAMGVEYLVFTAWHANLYPLFPSAAIERVAPGRSPRRDVLGAMLDAVRAKGVRVFFYTHPEQPVFGLDRQRWNDFLNDLYGEVAERYGSRLDGLYLDENSIIGDMDQREDFRRLERTIRARAPHLMLMQNFYGNMYACDVGVAEYTSFRPADPLTWGTVSYQGIAHVMSKTWSAQVPRGQPAVPFTPEGIFRFTVMQAGACLDGGGTFWAAGPFPGGGWETGVLETMRAVGALIAPIAPAIKGTLASTSYPTPTGTTMAALRWGVATRSPDDRIEYLHVLKAPAATSLDLPRPADGKVFGGARLLPSGHPVTCRQDETGLHLSLSAGDAWDPLDTVIELRTQSLPEAPSFRVVADTSPALVYGQVVTLDDTDPSLIYTGGGWRHQTGRDMGELNADIHYTTGDGESFSLPFDGTGVEFLSNCGGGRAQIDFYLDERYQGRVDMTQGSWARNLKFAARGLPPGKHVLRGVKQGGTYLEVDMFRVYRPGQGQWRAESALDRTWHSTAGHDDYVQLTFVGTGLDLITDLDRDGGTVDIFLDSALVRRVNHYRAEPQSQAVSVSLRGLPAGSHALTAVKKSGSRLVIRGGRICGPP